jgi:hypothetical protein
LVIITLLFDKLAGCTPASQIIRQKGATRRIVLASVASTASITMNLAQKTNKKQRVSYLIPRDYQPLANRIPGIAGL